MMHPPLAPPCACKHVTGASGAYGDGMTTVRSIHFDANGQSSASLCIFAPVANGHVHAWLWPPRAVRQSGSWPTLNHLNAAYPGGISTFLVNGAKLLSKVCRCTSWSIFKSIQLPGYIPAAKTKHVVYFVSLQVVLWVNTVMPTYDYTLNIMTIQTLPSKPVIFIK